MENYCQSRSIPYKRIPDLGTGHVGVIDITLTVLASFGQQLEDPGGFTQFDGYSGSYTTNGSGGTIGSWEGGGGGIANSSVVIR